MDIVSIFISVLLISFFLSNYLHKYKEEKQNKSILVYVIVGFILEWSVIFSLILNYRALLYALLIIFFACMIIMLIRCLIKINRLEREGKTNKECIIYGFRDIAYFSASFILLFQYTLYAIYKKLFMK